MTEVAFHFNAPDKLAYTCRLLRKAVASGARVVVTASAQTLQHLDQILWTFSATDFVAHGSDASEAAVRAHSPVVLSATPAQTPHQQVLVNLGESVPAGFERYQRLIEVVGQDDDDRAQARRRWKQYAERGYTLQRHDLALKESA